MGSCVQCVCEGLLPETVEGFFDAVRLQDGMEKKKNGA